MFGVSTVALKALFTGEYTIHFGIKRVTGLDFSEEQTLKLLVKAAK